jgi:hypothetical protein
MCKTGTVNMGAEFVALFCPFARGSTSTTSKQFAAPILVGSEIRILAKTRLYAIRTTAHVRPTQNIAPVAARQETRASTRSLLGAEFFPNSSSSSSSQFDYQEVYLHHHNVD